MSDDPPPSFTTISDTGGSATATYTLIYFPIHNPTLTQTGGLLSLTASGDSAPSTTSASSSASFVVSSGSTSSPASTTSIAVGAAPTHSTGSNTNDISTPVLSTPSSNSQTFSPITSSNPTTQATVGTPAPLHNNRLANGTVAGIVIGVAFGLAFITFLAILLAIRCRGGYVHVPPAKEIYRELRKKWGGCFSRQDKSFEPDHIVQKKVEEDMAVRTIKEAERLGDIKDVCG